MKSSYKLLNLILCAVAGLLVLVPLSCTPKQFPSNDDDTDINPLHDVRLNIALTGTPTTLDPHATTATLTAQITNSIYDTLISTSQSPHLAKSWEVSENLLVWTFYLRENVIFHHDKLFNGYDVKATIERIQDPFNESPAATDLAKITDVIVDIENDLIIRLVLETPDPTIPQVFASSTMAILPEDLINEGHSFATLPVGTGPYKFKPQEVSSKITLTANINYFHIPPAIPNITMYIMPDVNTQIQALQRGEVDVVPYIVSPELEILKKNEDIEIIPYPSATILLLAMNNRNSHLESLDFRRAIAHAIDKQKAIDIAYPSSTKTNIFWQKESAYFKNIPEIYNPSIAESFFKSYGELDTPLVISVPNNFAPHVKAAQVYQAQLKEVGLEVKVQPVSWSTWLNEVYGKGQFDLTVIGHTGKIDPYLRLNQFINGGYVGWNNEKFLDIMSQIEQESNAETLVTLYAQAFEIITNDYPFLFIGQASINIAIRKEFSNILFDPILETYDFRDAKFSPNTSKN